MTKKLFSKVKGNTCPACGEDRLFLVEYESTISMLDENGAIVTSASDDYTVKLVCEECGKEYRSVDKRGMTFKIQTGLPPVRKIMKDFNPFMP